MQKTIQCSYSLIQITGKEKKILFGSNSKEDAFVKYASFCDSMPKEKFQVVKKEVITEILAESEDYRQMSLGL